MIFDPKEEDGPFFYHGVQQKHRDITKRKNKNLQFTFDKVFSDDINNADIFEVATKDLIETLMNGYNCSVFAYGATGAGKTHTMLGKGQDPGITFLTMNELFKHRDRLLEERQFEICVTYLEVYNETVRDLLNPGPALGLRENGQYGVVVSGIQVHLIDKAERLFELLEQGNKNRTQHPTDANAESSRSHSVFQVYLRMKMISTNEMRLAKLSMIDLAGSERGAATGYGGVRFTEGANINKSLLALGNCINSLADNQKYVPYRDSKLTRLLKDSLGGNCRTVMIANVSPSSLTYEDTYNTLKYATRAKSIKANIKKNVTNDGNLAHYVNQIEELTKENERLKLELSLLSERRDEETVAKFEDYQISIIRLSSKVECLQKETNLKQDEVQMYYQLIEHFSKLLKPCLLQLKGYGLATEMLIAEYQGLVRHLQGIRSVKWDAEPILPSNSDAGVNRVLTSL